ncbi:energy-coupling factor transporter transmembrane component T family protein [Halococcus salsus]|uniref:energy-coupling factor transporter transmembrane component T family protein n=1 Tax=Halococcus salsus TaxID=2162894 RepID=UPI001357E6C9|nr:energy-coupling factor transporter transmembrane component T [Halococcus salsus]
MSGSTSLYVDKPTMLHRLNARSMLALLVGVLTTAYVFGNPVVVAVPLVALFVALVYAGGWRNVKRLSFVIVAVFLVGFVLWPAFTPPGDTVVLQTPWFAVTTYELLFALGRSERIVAFILGGLLFITTTSNEEIVTGLRSLGLPYAFCFAVGTALRLFPTFLGATGTVRQAQAARGHEVSGTNPIARFRAYIPLIVPVFMTAVRSVQTQAMALEARGFDPRRDRTFYDKPAFDTVDWAVVVVGLVLVVGSVWLSLQGYGQV